MKHHYQISQAVTEMFNKGSIDSHTKDFLSTKQPRPPCFYLLPKIYKPSYPGQPIVSSKCSPTENISAFVDFHLRPLVTKILSYIKDTSDFLRKLQDLPPFLDGTILAIVDVSSLYTKIPHTEGLKACKIALNKL